MFNIKLETGLAMAALALHAMFVAYLSSYYYALSRPITGPSIIDYPLQPLYVGLFLFAFPGFGLAGVAYFMAKRDAPKIVGALLIAQGILLPLGMYYASTQTDIINEEYRAYEILVVPQIFMFPGLVLIGLGVHIWKLKPIKRRYT